MNLIYFFADSPKEENCSKHNVKFPVAALNKYYPEHQVKYFHIDLFQNNTPEIQEECMNADIIILERNLFGDVLTSMLYYKVRNKKILTLFDDSYPHLQVDNPAYRFWKFGEMVGTNEKTKEHIRVYNTIKPLTMFRWGNQIANAIQVPNRVMQADWLPINDTYYLHNYINPEPYINSERIQKHDDIIVGWHGSLSHRYSFEHSGVIRALRNIVKKYPNVRILFGGDKSIADSISLPVGKKLYQPYVPEEQWAGTLKNYDIALAPLAGEYDRRRSWIRGIEYMACQIPWIGTNMETYEELKDYTVLVENKSECWENAISEMIDNLQKHRERVREEPYKFALEQSYEKNMYKNLEVYKQVLEKPYE
jgi:glycosyltransferase involved in cell wall biosynthesis